MLKLIRSKERGSALTALGLVGMLSQGSTIALAQSDAPPLDIGPVPTNSAAVALPALPASGVPQPRFSPNAQGPAASPSISLAAQRQGGAQRVSDAPALDLAQAPTRSPAPLPNRRTQPQTASDAPALDIGSGNDPVQVAALPSQQAGGWGAARVNSRRAPTAPTAPALPERRRSISDRLVGWLPGATANLELIAYHQETGIDDTHRLNPGNAVYRLPESISSIELRPELRWSNDTVSVEVSPRLGWSRTRTVAGGQSSTDSEWDARVAYGKIGYAKGPVAVQAGRYVNLWGPSVFASPSNPFHARSNAVSPYVELEARDYVEASYSPMGSKWSGRVIANVGAGDQRDGDPERLLVGEVGWFGAQVNANGLVQVGDGVLAVGGHGQWTPNEAVIVYGDGVVRMLDKRRLPKPGATGFIGDDDEVSATLLAGASYSLQDGTTLALEYLHNTDGYNGRQADAAFALGTGGLNPASGIGPDAIATLADVPFFDLRKNYAMARVTRQNLLDQVDVSALYAYGIDDNSGRLVGNLDWYVSDNAIIFVNGVMFHGDDESEFGRFSDHQVAVGLRVRPE